ncbi:f6d15931-3385-4669-a62b-4f1c6961c0f8 [Sclerotinia trifoliorum]|uniref:F6d15931-3385-4669-a62b-4f1c6961c0f8 n=1 Tax=Sclerotinia trifoliorum TaxID=28548 RepID=A0A8H2W4D3_9HELO|nr:f6d15931-3385-4669-a62b-4f1c6961c0f8 [Sclerotinia trifoliorum]
MVLSSRIKQCFAPTAPKREIKIIVHLMRHGEAYHNLGHFNGKINPESYNIPDPRLTKEGLKQAKSAQKKMAKCCPVPNIVLTSPLIRTIETTLYVFPNTNGSISHGLQIVAYDDLREIGAYLCNVRQEVLELETQYNQMGVDFTALSPVIPPMKDAIRAKQRAEIVRKEILKIARIIRKGGGFWKGVYIQGAAVQTFGWSLRKKTRGDVHIVLISHGSFMKSLLPSSHTNRRVWKKFKPGEMRTYVLNADGHLKETAESKGIRSTTVSQKNDDVEPHNWMLFGIFMWILGLLLCGFGIYFNGLMNTSSNKMFLDCLESGDECS